MHIANFTFYHKDSQNATKFICLFVIFSKDGARVSLVVAALGLVLLLVHIVSVALHILIAHDLVLELQLQLQELDFFLILFDLVLEITDLAFLAAAAEDGWTHRKVFINIVHVAKGHVASCQLVHLAFEALNLLYVLILLLRKLAHINVVEIDVYIVDSYGAVGSTLTLSHRHILLRLLHILKQLVLLPIDLFTVFLPSLLLFLLAIIVVKGKA